MSADAHTQKREYRETFGYRTDDAHVDQVRSNIEEAAKQLGLRLEVIDVIPRRRRQVKMKITVSGSGKSITALRENLHEISIFSATGGGGDDIASMLLGVIAGPIMDEAATVTRRGWWVIQRRRRGPADRDTSPEH